MVRGNGEEGEEPEKAEERVRPTDRRASCILPDFEQVRSLEVTRTNIVERFLTLVEAMATARCHVI